MGLIGTAVAEVEKNLPPMNFILDELISRVNVKAEIKSKKIYGIVSCQIHVFRTIKIFSKFYFIGFH